MECTEAPTDRPDSMSEKHFQSMDRKLVSFPGNTDLTLREGPGTIQWVGRSFESNWGHFLPVGLRVTVQGCCNSEKWDIFP